MTWGSEIEAMIKEVQDAQPEEVTDCPVCGWNVERLPTGDLHCSFCGWSTTPGRINK